MGLFDALKRRSQAVRFSFSFALHTLHPWLNSDKAISVAWQRGSKKKKRGVTEGHLPKQYEGQLGAIVELNELIQISATLYMDGNGEPNPSGPFKKKCLILAIVENGGRETNALGRVVIDLAEFAAMQNEVKRDFPVACSRSIALAVGDPNLTMTVKCMWKSSGGPASMASSMSSDRTGGTFSTNFNAFIRGTENEQIPVRLTGEQFDDLRGFDRLNTIKESENDYSMKSTMHRKSSRGSGHLRTRDSGGFSVDEFVPPPETDHPVQQPIKEEELSEELLKNHIRQMSMESNGGGLSPASPKPSEMQQDRTGEWLSGLQMGMSNTSPTAGLIYQMSDDMPIPSDLEEPPQLDQPVKSKPEVETEKDDESLSSRSPELDRSDPGSEDILSTSELFGAQKRLEGSGAKSPAKKQEGLGVSPYRSNLERRWKRVANPDLVESRSPSPPPRTTVLYRQSPARSLSPANRTSIRGEDATPASYLIAELKAAAFLEYSIYLARPGPHKYNGRNVHGPARRIARGLSTLGDNGEESVAVLQNCLQAIRVMVEACGSDVPGMAFWWGNCFQLRLLMSNCEDQDFSDWISRKMNQLVLKMEKSIFDRLQQFLWWKVFVPNISSVSPESKPAGFHEGNVQIWLNALHSVYEEFSLASSNGEGELGHLHLLRRKTVSNCCRMMDSLIFRELLCGATGSESFFDAMESFHDDLIGSQPRAWPKIHPSALPFTRGPLTFGVGMHLKMAVTRWSQWAIECQIKEPQHTGDPGQSFFPLLKATADLLMMPKELLTDESVRGELFAALSIRSMCILLEKFQPDEFAPDPVDPEVLRSLIAKTEDGVGFSLDLQEPPFKAGHESDFEMDLTFDSRSEAEMEAIIKSFPPTDNTISRFELLRNQWLGYSNK